LDLVDSVLDGVADTRIDVDDKGLGFGAEENSATIGGWHHGLYLDLRDGITHWLDLA
jgi:hypothetical protein